MQFRSLAEKRAFAAGAKAALDAADCTYRIHTSSSTDVLRAVERVWFDADHAAVAAEVEVSDG